MKNLTAVNNTLYDNDEGIHMRWIGATNMVLANNAIYSPDMTALNLAGSTGTFVANYVEGTADRSLDTTAFIDGGSETNAFVDPATWNFWLTTSSPLIGTANSTYAPGLDFNGGSRVSPFDVGAYETNAAPANPGWQMTEGFNIQEIGTRRRPRMVPTPLPPLLETPLETRPPPPPSR
jgi:hypothetical protein